MRSLQLIFARRLAGPPLAASPGAGFTPTRGRDLPFAAYGAGSNIDTLSWERTYNV